MIAVFLGRLLMACAALVALAGADTALAGAADYPSHVMAGVGETSRTVKLGLNKSLIVELPRDARDVLVSNPAIADAVIRSSRRIYLTGVAVGQASIFVFDKNDGLIVNLSLEVERDIAGLEGKLNALIEGAHISVDLFNDNIVLSGTVKNASDMQKALDLASAFANGGQNSQAQQDRGSGGSATAGAGGTSIVIGSADNETKKTSTVINMLSIEGEDQVHLKVTVAEIQRNIVKQLGIDLASATSLGQFATSVLTDNPFAVNSKFLTSAESSIGYGTDNNFIQGSVNALEQEGVLRTLAEPTLTAISGESASFLAGGEFPVPTQRDSSGNITVTYKPYGVGLDFTPVVLSEGRISLRIKTEVSEMSSNGALVGGGGSEQSNRSLSLPSVHVRRAQTTMELPSGGSIVMAGLLQDDIRQSIAGFPGLKDLPVLGTLFRSRDYLRQETELVIIVTPYLVKPVTRSALARPDDGFNTPNDANAMFLGRLNRMYGVQGKPAPQGKMTGRYGFIYE